MEGYELILYVMQKANPTACNDGINKCCVWKECDGKCSVLGFLYFLLHEEGVEEAEARLAGCV